MLWPLWQTKTLSERAHACGPTVATWTSWASVCLRSGHCEHTNTRESLHMFHCVQVSLCLPQSAPNHYKLCTLPRANMCMHMCVFSTYKCKHLVSIVPSVHMHGAGICLCLCACACCRQVEDCLPPEGLSLPAACGNHGALPGYKPLVCTDKKTWRAKINYLQADPCTPRLAWHFSCIKCHYLWSHPFYCLFYWSAVEKSVACSCINTPRPSSLLYLHCCFFFLKPPHSPKSSFLGSRC